MTNTALRAENSNSRTITFKSREHEKFYEEYLKKCRYQDVYNSQTKGSGDFDEKGGEA